jgi:hypothetical protein
MPMDRTQRGRWVREEGGSIRGDAPGGSSVMLPYLPAAVTVLLGEEMEAKSHFVAATMLFKCWQ